MDQENQHKKNAKKFVAVLLSEGTKARCDETNAAFTKQFGTAPDFLDEERCKGGQKFFHKHIFGMFFAKLLGLLSVLSMPTVLSLLKFTDMSSTSMTAYKRYMQTIFHMYTWYCTDFSKGSKLWKSLEEVRFKHNSASKRGCASSLSGITQKDMAVTQFGFIGYILVSTEQVGIYDATRKELEDLVHMWRVLGYILGVEERFNICRESLEETIEICKLIKETHIKPNLERNDADFFQMCEALIDGVWCMNPILQFNVFMGYLYYINLYDKNESDNDMNPIYDFISMNWCQRMHFNIILSVASWMQYAIIRVLLNWTMYYAIWTMPRFPYLAYLKFGIKNSKFSILNNRKNG